MMRSMLGFTVASVTLFASSMVQFALTFVAARMVARVGLGERLRVSLGQGAAGEEARRPGTGRKLVRVAAAAVCGAALPFGVYGALPLAAAALYVGGDAALAFIASNLLFNALVPFTDPTFIWRTGYPRVILALGAGLLAGLAAGRFKDAGRGLFREKAARVSLRAIWPFAAAGALAFSAFRSYGLGVIMNFMFTSPLTSALPYIFAQADVTNPFFILATRILMTLTDFSALAALAALLKIRGIIAYFVFFGLLAVLLGATAFL